MMKLTTPKKQPQYNFTRLGNLFYVTSEKNPNDRYMVVQHGMLFLCQCNDFFSRHLPELGSPNFSLCKHGEFVQQATRAVPGAKIVEAVKHDKHATTITGTVEI